MSARDVELRPATEADDSAIRELLAAAGLPVADIDAARQAFIVAIADASTEGCIGLELHGDVALLRSLAVREQRRGAGVGNALLESARELAISHRVATLFLLTTTASQYFGRRGFVTVDRAVVPQAIARGAQFTALCPSTATCMMLKL
jgi:N-acetylglutamate synthase-like GNAT family acetyltransferase